GVGMYACALAQIGLFYSIGEYTAARGGGTDFVFGYSQYLLGIAVGLPVGAIFAIVTALLLGNLVLGMRGQYFAICTLGLGVAGGELAAGWEWIGAGSGLTPAPPPEELGDPNRFYYYLSVVLAVATFLTIRWLLSTRFGLAINAIRD